MENKEELRKIIVGLALFLLSFVFKNTLHIIILLMAYAVLGYEVIISAVKNALHGEFFDENTLMTIATVAALCLGDFNEAVFVMLFYSVGEFAQDLATDKSRDKIKDLIDLNPGKVRVNGKLKSPENVVIGTIFKVLPGEKIVIDGVIESGKSFLDTKAVTGESAPVQGKKGLEVTSGTIVLDSPIEIKATKKYSDSTLYQIIKIIEESEDYKAPTDRFITRFARYYTPAVVGAGFVIAVVPSLFTGNWHTWIYRALNFLVISCPCALVLSIPLAFFAGIGKCAKNGILVKGAEHIERLADTEAFVFDKTGTLTEGNFSVQQVITAEDSDSEDVLKTALSLESNSLHPIATAISKYCKENKISSKAASAIEEIPGMGIEGLIKKTPVMVGNSKLMEAIGIKVNKITDFGTTVYVSKGGKYLGCIVISDTVKSNAKTAIQELKNLGIKKTVMLSGDVEAPARQVANLTGIDEYYSGLLPVEKTKKIKELKEMYVCTYCGDGLNDIPVMLESDTSISMGKIGSDAAVEASSIVFLNDDLSKLPLALKISRKTLSIAHQNIALALLVKLVCLVLASFGITGLALSVFADTGVALLAILNSIRALY